MPKKSKVQKRKKGFLSRLGSTTGGKALLVALIFGVVGAGYMLYQTFALINSVEFWGTLTKSNPTVSYRMTTGSGNMEISFKNNTADLALAVTNSSNKQIGYVKSIGTTPVTLKMTVPAGTYKLSLKATKPFEGAASNKGYKIVVGFPTNQPAKPTAVITSPLNGTTLSGTVDYTVKAESDAGISKVEFYAAGAKLDTDTTAPYSIKWDTSVLNNGVYQLEAKSYDRGGNMGVASGAVTVKNQVAGGGGSGSGSSRFAGDPNPKVNGKSYWGASITANGNPAKHEDVIGKSLSLRRTFWSWDQAANTGSSMYSTVQSDQSNNRLPFISIKTAGWAAMASGKHDAQIDAMLKKLNSFGKPVWLTAHHEPEGGGASAGVDDPGGPSAWRAMQSKIRQRITATNTKKNIAFMPILMGYTWNPQSGRNPADWWVPGIWDAYVIDHYVKDESAPSIMTAKGSSFLNFVKWAEAKGLPFGIGEWANQGTNAQTAQEMQDFWNWAFTNKKDMIGYSYYDSALHGDFRLEGEPLLKFRQILKSDSRVQRINEL